MFSSNPLILFLGLVSFGIFFYLLRIRASKNQIDSFDAFINDNIPKTIIQFNPLELPYIYNEENDSYFFELKITLGGSLDENGRVFYSYVNKIGNDGWYLEEWKKDMAAYDAKKRRKESNDT